MLSVLPAYDRPRDRESERPFKSYSSRALNQHNTTSPYYSPFTTSNSSYLSSVGFPSAHNNNAPATTKQDAAMDLRPPPVSMYETHQHPAHHRGYGDQGAMIDMASHMSHRIPSIKQESSHHMANHHPTMSTYPNMHHAHSNGYTNLTATNMPSLRDMGSPPQAAVPTLGDNANSPPQSSTSNMNTNNSTATPAVQPLPAPVQNHTTPPVLDIRPVASTSPTENTSVSPLSGSLQLPTTIVPSNAPLSKMPPKKRPIAVPETQKDTLYWEKRKKNNESARRSRESRRMKEDHIAVRVVYLEQENLQLRTEVSLLKSEIEKLRCMLYNS